MGKGGLVTYDNSAVLDIVFQITGSIFDNVLPKVCRQRSQHSKHCSRKLRS
eukprot:COSAG02_NODE_42403_length_385_cov_0.472028_1_plen_50_part_10